ncbi:MAG: hypothetical protein ACXWMO_04790, partial [Syntrophales bacterium]
FWSLWFWDTRFLPILTQYFSRIAFLEIEAKIYSKSSELQELSQFQLRRKLQPRHPTLSYAK